MKITCQACQAKYTIADEKIQGKIAKIRCRKCGATVLVDASSGGAAKAEAAGPAAAGATDSWLVSVAEGDQRTMTQRDVVEAHAANVITGDTYVWKEGMTDWQPLAEVAELMTAINAAAPLAISPSAPPELEPEPAAAPAPAAAPTPVAARRDPGRAGADLFAGGPIDDEVATSAPPHMLARAGVGNAAAASSGMASAGQGGGGGLTGARDEHSVLFSLSALTGGPKNAPAPAAPSASPALAPAPVRNEDSGLIDLNALAQAQRTRMPQAAESAPTPAAFVFPAALGTVEVPRESSPRSKMPMFIGGGIALAGVIIAVIILAAGKKEEAPTTAATASASAAAPAEPSVAATAAPSPTTSSSAETAAASDSANAKPIRRTPGTSRPTSRPGPATPVAPAQPVAPVVPPPKKSPCGCATGDLQCQIRCSAMGH